MTVLAYTAADTCFRVANFRFGNPGIVLVQAVSRAAIQRDTSAY